jgi:hypothetical protein
LPSEQAHEQRLQIVGRLAPSCSRGYGISVTAFDRAREIFGFSIMMDQPKMSLLAVRREFYQPAGDWFGRFGRRQPPP